MGGLPPSSRKEVKLGAQQEAGSRGVGTSWMWEGSPRPALSWELPRGGPPSLIHPSTHIVIQGSHPIRHSVIQQLLHSDLLREKMAGAVC